MLGLDTAIFIYHFEAHPRYQPLTQVVLRSVESGRHTAATSTITLMELTVQPWQVGREGVAREYESHLVHFPNLILAEVTRHVARRAAQLRARFNLRPADALHVATALLHGASAFVTNDRRLSRLRSHLDILILDDFTPP
ncbi:MAG TPA: type II toxin-antitoxin system VapC family toxin [Anaerolineae bacterium]|jgi:predicted nucleic acid-binding protein|nr:type II toxin-antitoxin system VapC family toxin [Anaerolineae bacterium]